MEKDIEKTKVIFRIFEGEVIAIFPEELSSDNPNFCLSYMHLGQHSGCDPYGVIEVGRPALPEEYESLKNELENHVGYNLQIIKRNRQSYYLLRYDKAIDRHIETHPNSLLKSLRSKNG